MNPLHLAHTTSLMVTSFGAGIGLVTAGVVLNYISDALRNAKRRRHRLPTVRDRDLHLVVQRQPRAPVPALGVTPQMPMVMPRRQV